MGAKIYQIGGRAQDSNIYLIDDEILTLVDAGTGMYSEGVEDEMRRLGFSPSDLDLLVNTHCHFDHAGGDHDLVDASGCEVAIHELEAPLLEKGDEKISCAAMFGEKLKPVKVTRVLKEGGTLDLGHFTLKVLHTPGHTAGSISLHDHEKRVLFSGDVVFCGGVGRTDLPTGDRSLTPLARAPEGTGGGETLPGPRSIHRAEG
jgi:glyoxylase-like metal-dependent hydrolase (beta-lactamase superfamily II)